MNRYDGPEDQSLDGRCMSGRTPDLNGHRRIVQGADAVAIAYDTGQGQGFQRLVNLGGSHSPANIRLRQGDSRGRWEGQTLVVETRNFSPKFPYQRSAENRRLVERYTRIGEDTLAYEMTIEDPTVSLWLAFRRSPRSGPCVAPFGGISRAAVWPRSRVPPTRPPAAKRGRSPIRSVPSRRLGDCLRSSVHRPRALSL